MKSETPITLAVAIYGNREDAVADYDFLRQVKSTGDLDHIAIAVLTKEADGHVQVERHDSTAKHLAWAGALTGGAMLVLAPAAAPIAIASSLGFGGGASAAGLAGVGGVAGHFWHNVPKERVARDERPARTRASPASSWWPSTTGVPTWSTCSPGRRRSSSTTPPRATSSTPTTTPSPAPPPEPRHAPAVRSGFGSARRGAFTEPGTGVGQRSRQAELRGRVVGLRANGSGATSVSEELVGRRSR